MRDPSFDPRHLDVEAFARSGAAIEGQWPIAGLERLRQSLHEPPGAGAVTWSAAGDRAQSASSEAPVWLDVAARATVTLQCQRCLGALPTDLVVERRFRFARDESAAQALDAEVEDDVLALTRSLDLHQLIEDELLLALPLVPRHERCPVPLLAPTEPPAGIERRDNPFGVLQALRKAPTAD